MSGLKNKRFNALPHSTTTSPIIQAETPQSHRQRTFVFVWAGGEGIEPTSCLCPKQLSGSLDLLNLQKEDGWSWSPNDVPIFKYLLMEHGHRNLPKSVFSHLRLFLVFTEKHVAAEIFRCLVKHTSRWQGTWLPVVGAGLPLKLVSCDFWWLYGHQYHWSLHA